MPKPERGIGHAFLRPAESLTDFDDADRAGLPQLLLRAAADGPALLPARCRRARDRRRASGRSARGHRRLRGPLAHAARQGRLSRRDVRPGAPGKFSVGDARGMAQPLRRLPGAGRRRQPGDGAPGPGTTGLPDTPGPRGGTRETCNWIAAAAVVEGRPGTLVDYVPIYSSPIGAAFAYWSGGSDAGLGVRVGGLS